MALPVEILVDIMFHARASDRRRWVRMLEVCRHWRDVGVSVPLLWSHIEVDTKLFPLLLHLLRSNNLPLDITIKNKVPQTHLLLAAQGPRIRRLSLRAPGLGDPRVPSWLLPQVMHPALEELCLTKDQLSRHRFFRDICIKLDSGTFPKLRSISFDGFYPLPASSVLSQLHTLILQTINHKSFTPYTLISLLRECRSLRSLSFVDIWLGRAFEPSSWDEEEYDSHPPSGPVFLPNLTNVDLFAPMPAIRTLLATLQFSETVDLHVAILLPDGVRRDPIARDLRDLGDRVPIMADGQASAVGSLRCEPLPAETTIPATTSLGHIPGAAAVPEPEARPLHQNHKASLPLLKKALQALEQRPTSLVQVVDTFGSTPQLQTLYINMVCRPESVRNPRWLYMLLWFSVMTQDFIAASSEEMVLSELAHATVCECSECRIFAEIARTQNEREMRGT